MSAVMPWLPRVDGMHQRRPAVYTPALVNVGSLGEQFHDGLSVAGSRLTD
jgi:hypothetical protein